MTIRLFGHYLSSSLLLLMAAEGAVVWAAVYAGLLLPYLGLPQVVPTWYGPPLPVAIILTFFVLTSLDLAGLSDIRQRYRRAELFLRLTLAFGLAYLLIAVLGYFVPLLRLSRQSYLLSLT